MYLLNLYLKYVSHCLCLKYYFIEDFELEVKTIYPSGLIAYREGKLKGFKYLWINCNNIDINPMSFEEFKVYPNSTSSHYKYYYEDFAWRILNIDNLTLKDEIT
jgi:hypothetical protein